MIMHVDENECSSNNGGCAHSCQNTIGSYNCYCINGHILDDDGLGCSGFIRIMLMMNLKLYIL